MHMKRPHTELLPDTFSDLKYHRNAIEAEATPWELAALP